MDVGFLGGIGICSLVAFVSLAFVCGLNERAKTKGEEYYKSYNVLYKIW